MNLGEAIKKINEISSKPVELRDIYIFSVILADNDIDDDREAISNEALQQLAEECIGKTGYIDNDNVDYHARIFDTEICTSSFKNKLGDNKRFLKAYCWIKKTPENKEIIQAIRNSITKKGTLSFSLNRKICSKCGCNTLREHCRCKYGYKILNSIIDVYDWDFMPIVKGKD
jgi:hypothetical protein